MELATPTRRQRLALLLLLALRGVAPETADADSPPANEPASTHAMAVADVDRPSPANADENRLEFIHTHIMQASARVLGAVGVDLRMVAALNACDLKGLARALDRDEKDRSPALEEYFKATPAAAGFRSEISAGVMNSLAYYVLGYQQAFELFLTTDSEAQRRMICQEVAKQASEHIETVNRPGST